MQVVPSFVNSTQPQLRDQGTTLNSSDQIAYQAAISSNGINRISSPSQLQSVQRNSGQNCAQSSGQAYVQQFTQQLPRGPQVCSPPKPSEASKSGEMDSMAVSSDMKTTVVDKGKGGVPGSAKGSFLYGGQQVMGASGVPTLFQFMQFGGQHPGGIGVPAVGMTYPGYVGQPQGGSDMTWLPVLTGAAGALGATYCPPYIAVDGSYNTHPSGTAPPMATTSSKETSTVKVGNKWKPAQSPELANHDFEQKPKNPRRYTEMKFDQ